MSTREETLRLLLQETKRLAARYYELTNKPLGVSGEVAELEAAEKLGLDLAVARTPGYDAVGTGEREGFKYQIKGRAVDRDDRYRGRVSKISLSGEFDAVLLVLLDKTTYEALEIWEASRDYVTRRLNTPGSKSRNERGSLGISQFKSNQLAGETAKCIWRSTG